ncbi:MAG: hypothetical protein HQK51_16530 [Oligoflexia bacterium]|nr:hypothetical protein [Oligoflexia bacterium]
MKKSILNNKNGNHLSQILQKKSRLLLFVILIFLLLNTFYYFVLSLKDKTTTITSSLSSSAAALQRSYLNDSSLIEVQIPLKIFFPIKNLNSNQNQNQNQNQNIKIAVFDSDNKLITAPAYIYTNEVANLKQTSEQIDLITILINKKDVKKVLNVDEKKYWKALPFIEEVSSSNSLTKNKNNEKNTEETGHEIKL